jgi:hypothetical protein
MPAQFKTLKKCTLVLKVLSLTERLTWTSHLQGADQVACMRSGEDVGGPTNSVTRKELGALYAVTGPPTWQRVEGMQLAIWRTH